jgi:hypothetical protein
MLQSVHRREKRKEVEKEQRNMRRRKKIMI